jgi:hypothetical protein
MVFPPPSVLSMLPLRSLPSFPIPCPSFGLRPVLMLAGAIAIAGCQTNPTAQNPATTAIAANLNPISQRATIKTASLDGAIASDGGTAQPAPAATPEMDEPVDDAIAIEMYTPDDTCRNLRSQIIQVPADRPIDAAVGRVLIAVASDDLDLQGYRLRVDSSKREATIDLRIRPGAERRFAALSSCEQLTLFGSVRETLVRNSNWPIETVRFTDGTREIRL